MHTTVRNVEDGPWTVHHNGDFSGDLVFFVPTYHPNKRYQNQNRVEFVNNKSSRDFYEKLIHDPIEDIDPDGYIVKIPYTVVEEVVAERIRRELVSSLEEMDTDDLLRYLLTGKLA